MRRYRYTGFNPVRSSKARFLETRADGLKIYSHTMRGVAGFFAVTNAAGDTWTTAETLAEARSMHKSELS